jgi:hypothetical protein
MPGGRMARLANYNDQNPEAFPAEEDPRHTRVFSNSRLSDLGVSKGRLG